jgi:hypothetical protein
MKSRETLNTEPQANRIEGNERHIGREKWRKKNMECK